jgi:2-polyprenyl-6-methoxyphenol hydroxylase-like FAD-dependent oxidoreductase
VPDNVLIIGAGPVGLMLACELGLAGVATTVIERHLRPRLESPGIVINASVVELLGQRGLLEGMEADGIELPQAHFAHLRLEPAKLHGRHPYPICVPHARLERRLEAHAVKLGVEVIRGQELAGLEDSDAGVTAYLRSGEEGHFLQARYLVGCDGADSQVRRLAGIEFGLQEAPFYGITGDVIIQPGSELLSLVGAHYLPGGAFSVVPTGPEFLRVMAAAASGQPAGEPLVMRILTGEFDAEPQDPGAPVTAAELRAHARRVTGRDVDMGEPAWLTRWRDVTGQAASYRSGSVFLAGDAAHVMFPLGGTALSTGIEDAVNLGWKLAAELRGQAPGGLLDSYHAERHPVGARALLTARAQVVLLHPLDRLGPAREVMTELIQLDDVNEYLVKMAAGLDVRYPLEQAADQADRTGLTGRRLPAIALKTADGRDTDTAQLMRAGRGVVLDLSGLAWPPGLLAGWADRIDVVAAAPAPGIDAPVIFIRPDGRVAWAGDAVTDGALRAALTAWLGVSSIDLERAATCA